VPLSVHASISINSQPIKAKIGRASKRNISTTVSFIGRLNRRHIDRDRDIQRYVENVVKIILFFTFWFLIQQIFTSNQTILSMVS
jgi:hypothetical protein